MVPYRGICGGAITVRSEPRLHGTAGPALGLFGAAQEACIFGSLQGQSKSQRNMRGAFSPGRWMRTSIAAGSGAKALKLRTPLR